MARHLVGPREDDVLDHAFDATAFLQESNRKMVQETRVRRSFPEKAKVVSGWHNATAHEMVPDAIHDQARCQWIRRIIDLLNQFQSTASRFNWHWRITGVAPAAERADRPGHG